MAPQKETLMVLTVDLECNRCYTKVKRTLCSFPQVQDQIYKEKENKVLIKVVCCSPEKIRDKLCDKGGKSIKAIEILEQKKPPDDKAAEKTKEAPPANKQKQATPADNTPTAQAAGKPKKKVTFKLDEQPAKPQAAGKAKKKVTFKLDEQPAKAKEAPPAAAAPKPAERAAMMALIVPAPVYGYGYPVNVGCLDCYEGRMCGYHSNGSGYGYGVPPPTPPAGGYGYKPGYCGDYVSDENASGCGVM